jgi:hypothetical protein
VTGLRSNKLKLKNFILRTIYNPRYKLQIFIEKEHSAAAPNALCDWRKTQQLSLLRISHRIWIFSPSLSKKRDVGPMLDAALEVA